MDGTGYTSEQGDLYYRGRTGKKRIAYTKNHISIDTKNTTNTTLASTERTKTRLANGNTTLKTFTQRI